MIQLCVSLVLALHLLCVNVASAGPLVSAWLDWVARSKDDLSWRAARALSLSSLVMLLVGSGLGLAAAGLLWSDAYHELMHAFMYKIKWAGWELLFSVVLMIIHAFLVWRGPARGFLGRYLRAGIALLAATNLLYHFPSLLLVITEMNAGYVDQPKAVDAKLFRGLMSEPSVVARSVHFVLASVAVTGIVLVMQALRLKRREETEADGKRLAVWGARIALVPTVLQIVVGIWVLAVLPPSMQQRLLGGDLLAAGMLACSIMGAFYLMHQLAAVSMGDTSTLKLRLAIWLMIGVVVFMTITASLGATRATAASTFQQTEHLHAS